MKISFKERPTEEQLDLYKRKIEFFLRSLDVKLGIDLWPDPLGVMKGFVNDRLEFETTLWIQNVRIETPEIKFDTSLPLRRGIDNDSLKNEHVWLDAHSYQAEIYSLLNKVPKTPLPNDDPYWKLWDIMPSKMNLPEWMRN